MKRTTVLRHLSRAKVQAALAHEHLERQRRVIGDLKARGLDAIAARQTLTTLEQSQARHENEVKQLTAELAGAQ